MQAKAADAEQRAHAARPKLKLDGGMQADTTVSESILTGSYPGSRLHGPANVLIFPGLNAAKAWRR